MDLRNLPEGMASFERIRERKSRIESELGCDLSHVHIADDQLGSADEKNCEQMFGSIPVPVGYAGALKIMFSNEQRAQLHLPLATTEGALVASVNRGCKALSEMGVFITESIHHGISRSIALKAEDPKLTAAHLEERREEWKKAAEATSNHLRLQKYKIDVSGDYTFLTLFADTDEAMGMNMITLAAQAVGQWCSEHLECEFVTVAGNVDSDKKPSRRTLEKGRGYEVKAEAILTPSIIENILKSSIPAILEVADAKLHHGSALAGSLGTNLHAANMIAALYLATGQDAAHVVEGSLAETEVSIDGDDLLISVRLPAILVGVRGGGTALPAQRNCLDLLLGPKTTLHPKQQLAESIAGAVLAGELSLLAAQANHELAKAHKKLGR